MNFHTIPAYLPQMIALFELFEAEGFATPRIASTIVASYDSLPDNAEFNAQARRMMTEALLSGDAGLIEAARLSFTASLSGGVTSASSASEVKAQVSDIALAQLLQKYPFAGAYEAVAVHYNEAAAALHAAVDTVRADTDPDDLDEATLRVWQAIPGLAAEVERLGSLLVVAFELANGGDTVHTNYLEVLGLLAMHGEDETDQVVPVWLGETTPNGSVRGGVWVDLITAGAVLGAPASVDDQASWLVPVEPPVEVLRSGYGA